MSYDRLTAIVLPRESRITIRDAKIIMIFTWFTGFTLALPLAIYRNYRVRKNRELRYFLFSFRLARFHAVFIEWIYISGT